MESVSCEQTQARHEHKEQEAEEHTEHEPSEHSGHEIMFRNRFWVSLLLSIPALLYSETIQGWLGFSMPAFPGSQWFHPVSGGRCSGNVAQHSDCGSQCPVAAAAPV